jgi:pimeloyl-[acyl-carrier protein] methyl ester esterase
MLHHEVRGAGPDLVMVHGWGMHAGVWSDWADRLATRWRVHLVDLPGHGLSDYSVGPRLDDWSAAVAEVVPAGAWWLGWSLGGLVTLNLARLAPHTVRGLLLIASTPRFVTAADWPCAVDAAVFEHFAGQLRQAVERTLVRFLSLQVRGSDESGGALRHLRAVLRERPYPQAEALAAGLQLLRNSDLRRALPELDIPIGWLFGERDTLVPMAAGTRLPGRQAVIAGAAHAPFLSHPQRCADQVTEWLTDMPATPRHAAG